MSTTLDRRDAALECLSVDERSAFDRYDRQNRPGVNLQFNQRLYEVFLRGLTCEGIALLNPGLSLGQVVKARVEGNWDERRSAYTTELLNHSNDLLRQTAAESIEFLSLVLAVAHKQYGEQFRKYLATGDASELGDFKVTNFSGYQKIIQTIAQLIGADQKKTVTHKIVGSGAVSSEETGDGLVGASIPGRITPKQADAMRAALERTKE